MWEAIKECFIYILKWLGLLGMLFMAVVGVYAFFTETSGMWQAREAHPVEDKFTHKGLYFEQRYFVELSNGDTHSVFKRDFNRLEKGDLYNPFFHALSWKDFTLIFTMLGTITILFLSMTYFFAFLIFRETKWFQKLEIKRNELMAWFVSVIEKNEKTKDRWKKWSLLLLIIAMSIPNLLLAKNIIIKTIPIGKESATAVIIDREIVRSTGYRRVSNTYTLTYIFKDQDNSVYKTKKDVSEKTYRNYEYKPTIPIFYRKKFPYESFIDIQSIDEVFSSIFRRSNLIIVINGGLLLYCMKVFLNKWGKSIQRREIGG